MDSSPVASRDTARGAGRTAGSRLDRGGRNLFFAQSSSRTVYVMIQSVKTVQRPDMTAYLHLRRVAVDHVASASNLGDTVESPVEVAVHLRCVGICAHCEPKDAMAAHQCCIQHAIAESRSSRMNDEVEVAPADGLICVVFLKFILSWKGTHAWSACCLWCHWHVSDSSSSLFLPSCFSCL